MNVPGHSTACQCEGCESTISARRDRYPILFKFVTKYLQAMGDYRVTNNQDSWMSLALKRAEALNKLRVALERIRTLDHGKLFNVEASDTIAGLVNIATEALINDS